MRLVTSIKTSSDFPFVQATNLPFDKQPHRIRSGGVSYFLPHRNSKLIALPMNVRKVLTFSDTQVRDGILNFALKVPVRIPNQPTERDTHITPSASIGSPREYSAISTNHPYQKSGEKAKGYSVSLLVL